MKLVNLSLVAMIAISTSAFAGDSLVEAFKNAKVKGMLKAYYFDREYTSKSADILNYGVTLNYLTDDFKGFKFGTTVQTNSAGFADEETKAEYSKPFDMYGSGAVLSEAYLAYSMNKTTLKVGRQFINMPLMKGSGSRLVVEAYEGVSVVSKDIPNTILMGAYVNKHQDRTSGTGDIPDFKALEGDYGYALAIINKSITGLKLTAAYGERDEVRTMYAGEALYKGNIENVRFLAGAQYLNTDYDSATNNDASLYGAKLGFGVGGLNAYVAYADIQDGYTDYDVVGAGNRLYLYTSTKVDGGMYHESEQYAVDVNYGFKDLGLSVGARYVNAKFASSNHPEINGGRGDIGDTDYTALYGMYKFKGALKGLMAMVHYEQKDSENDNHDKDELRIRTIYKF